MSSRRLMPDPMMKRQSPPISASAVAAYSAYLSTGGSGVIAAPKRRATTAAVVAAEKKDPFAAFMRGDVIQIHAGLTQATTPIARSQPVRPHSGPQVGLTSHRSQETVRPRIPLAVAQSPAQFAWADANNVAAGASTANTSLLKKASVLRSMRPGLVAAGTRKPRNAALQSPTIVPFAARTKTRTRPPLAAQLGHLAAQTEKLIGAIHRGDVRTTDLDLAAPAPVESADPNRPAGFFDPIASMYPSSSPDHLLSVSTKRFVVGRLTCKYPSMCHFKSDRVCYMFAHPTQDGTQILMDMHYNDMVDLKCSASSATGSGSFSFKIPHHLPAFDGYGDYEPHMRNHRLTIEFNSYTDAAKFKTNVYPLVQQATKRR